MVTTTLIAIAKNYMSHSAPFRTEIVARIEEQKLVDANKKLIELFRWEDKGEDCGGVGLINKRTIKSFPVFAAISLNIIFDIR
ncbi:Uncharacterised protein [uncultured archaeon]|nr:Uncharacterised protein [uncultured archaeon]